MKMYANVDVAIILCYNKIRCRRIMQRGDRMGKAILFVVMIIVVIGACLACAVYFIRKESADGIEEHESGNNTEEED